MINTLVLSLVAYLVFLLLLNSLPLKMSNSKSKVNGWSVFGTLLSGAAVVASLIWLTTSDNLSSNSEVQTGVLIVLAVSTLVFLLFILTLGFQTLGLSDVGQPLALPPGSIRAFIALMLIMIFVIVSVFAVRLVGAGIFSFLGYYKDEEVVQQYLGSDNFIVQRNLNDPERPYRVWQVRQISADGIRMAQQLITTVATLVVAVSGFYFGTQAVEKAKEAVGAALATHEASTPLIRNIDPNKGKTLDTIVVTLKGRNLSFAKFVRLVRDQETLEATDILSNNTTVQCALTLDKPAGTIWTVVVENMDGEKDQLEDAFTITEKKASSTTGPAAPVDVPPSEQVPPAPVAEPDADQSGLPMGG